MAVTNYAGKRRDSVTTRVERQRPEALVCLSSAHIDARVALEWRELFRHHTRLQQVCIKYCGADWLVRAEAAPNMALLGVAHVALPSPARQTAPPKTSTLSKSALKCRGRLARSAAPARIRAVKYIKSNASENDGALLNACPTRNVFDGSGMIPMIDGQPVVSVIMSMRNASATVGDTIRSLQWQTLSDWELILFDDGSADRSVGAIESLNDPRIRFFADGRHMGLAARLNQGVGMARGRFIARIDADDICFPLRLEKQVTFLEAHPQVDLIASSAVVFSGDEPIGLLPVRLDHEDIVRHPFLGFSFPHPTWCGRAEWFRTNPYDASLGKTQDQDLLLRSYGHSTFAAIDDVLVGYRQPRLELGKLLRGRLIFSRSVWRHARATGPLVSGINGILSQAIRAAADIVTIGIGLNRWSQRRRLHAIPREVCDSWLSLRARLQCNQGT